MNTKPGRNELDRAWAITSPLFPAATGSFLLGYLTSSLVLTWSLKPTDGPFVVVFAALMIVLVVAELRGVPRSDARRRRFIFCAALVGVVPVMVSVLSS